MTRQEIRLLCVCSLEGSLKKKEEKKKTVFFVCVFFERNESVKGKELSLQLYGEAFQAYIINIGNVNVCTYTCVYICIRVYP